MIALDQLKDVKLMEELKAEKFDFAFTEYFDICGVALFERIGVEKYGALISSTLNGLITSGYGIPLTLSFIPDEAYLYSFLSSVF